MPVRNPNEHVPPSERKDHPAVQRMQHKKLMKKVKTYLALFAILAGLLGVYVWKYMKSEGKDIKDIGITDLKDAGSHLVSDTKDAVKEVVAGAEEEWARQNNPSDEDLSKMLRKKTAAAPTPAPATTPAPSTPQPATPPDPKIAPPPTPAPTPPAPQLSPEEKQAQDLVKEANKLYDESYDHHEKYRSAPASDTATRKKEINAAFDAVSKAKEKYQKAQGLLGEGSSDWLDQRVQECLQRYKVLKNAKGTN